MNNEKKFQEQLKQELLKPLDKIRAERSILNENNSISQNKGIYEISLQQYINNPTGKGSGYVANRGAIKTGLNSQYIELLRNFRKAFYAIPYLYENGDILYYVKVPSEYYKDNKISYDVLFLLKYEKNVTRSNRNIQLFSNCMSFIYTYAYVYNKKGLIINKFKTKLPNECLTIPAEIRNPIESLGYEKSTYMAARYLVDGGCITDSYINQFGKKIDNIIEKKLIDQITDPKTLQLIYQHTQYLKRKNHKKQLTDNEKKTKDDIKTNYISKQKKIIPKSSIIHKAPRSKITAKKAKKSLINKK